MVQNTFSWLIQPEKIAAYYTDERDAIKFIGYPLYLVRRNGEPRYYQNNVIAREYIAELKDNGEMYSYVICKSPNETEQIECWLPPPAQK